MGAPRPPGPLYWQQVKRALIDALRVTGAELVDRAGRPTDRTLSAVAIAITEHLSPRKRKEGGP